MLDESIQELVSRSLARIAAANSLDELEAVRVDALGRKAGLSQISKEMGKLAPEERKRIGQLLNAARQKLEAALESQEAVLRPTPPSRARLDAEWVDLTLPAPGPRRGHLHPITRIQRELEELFVSLGLRRAGWPRGRDRILQLRRPEHPAGPSRARHAGHLLAGWRQPAAHPHLARAGARHGAPGPAAAHDRARPRLPQRERGRLATSTPSTSSKA